MFYLNNGDIIPEEGIGIIKLGMSFEQIIELFIEYEVRELDDTWRIMAGDVHVWVDKEKNRTYQITVFDGFQGTYAGLIGIGSTLTDIRKYLGVSWHEELEVIVLDNEPNMCFEFTDDADDEWDEVEDYETFQLRAPIGYISVNRYLSGQPRWNEATQSVQYS